MALEEQFANSLTLIGGVSGAALLAYMVLMIYFNRKKDRDIQALHREVAEIKGILLGRLRR